jgi:tetrahydromethanopterin S-methyltransferase subunit G
MASAAPHQNDSGGPDLRQIDRKLAELTQRLDQQSRRLGLLLQTAIGLLIFTILLAVVIFLALR